MENVGKNQNIPAEILAEAEQATLELLPRKSKEAYEKEFAEFINWKEKRGCVTSVITEELLLAYFLNISKRYASSSSWTKYSMLKTTLKVHRNIDIAKFSKLTAFLKSQSRTYKPKKAKILEEEHIKQFLQKAPDTKYLMMKVILVIFYIDAY